MRDQKGVGTIHFRKIISNGLSDGYINRGLLEGLEKVKEGFESGDFRPNAQTREEAIRRTEAVLSGLPDAHEMAEEYIEYMDAESLGGEGTEAHFRVRLLAQMNGALKKGGIVLPGGELDKDVAGVVITVVKELNPELNRPQLTEVNLSEKRI